MEASDSRPLSAFIQLTQPVPGVKGCAAGKQSSGACASKASRILNALDPGPWPLRKPLFA
jgi:hypothetical protein